jgi:protoporphyrinogen oxidase
MPEPHIVILGAGPAGVGGAYQLRRQQRARVTVLEQNPVVGGNAGSFTLEGLRVDFGSHRLHPACEPEILADIRNFLGADLLDRPRHGRIGLRGRWIHFPLKPVDLLLRLDPGFTAGTLGDMVAKPFRKGTAGDTFASVLWANLGPTICQDFYFPYARKIWGRAPEELSGIQARRRVSAGSFGKLIRKVLGAVPGLKPPGAGRFYYPRQGFGQISEAYADAAVKAGADLRLGARVARLAPRTGAPGWTVETEDGGRHEADYLWSTIPITTLARAIPGTPAEVQAASGRISYRAMLLVYLVLDVEQFTEYDAHYFPDAKIRITRLSEPKNYGLAALPGKTILCAELPCDADDATWQLDDAALGRLVSDDLARAGVPLPRPAIGVSVRRLRQAYPIYLNGYEEPLGVLDRWAEQLPRVLSYGRQGLFAHDNTHHALFMAYAAAECVEPGGFNDAKWADYRRVFATHVVED